MSALTDRIKQEIAQAVEAKNELCQNYRDKMSEIDNDIEVKTNELNAQLDDLENCDVAEVTNLRHEIESLKEDRQSADIMLFKCLEKQAITPEVARGYCSEIVEEFDVFHKNTLKAIEPSVKTIISKCDEYLEKYTTEYLPVNGQAYSFSRETDKNGYSVSGSKINVSVIEYMRKLRSCLVEIERITDNLNSMNV